MTITCCRDCKKRWVNVIDKTRCHTTCPEYQTEMLKEEILKQVRLSDISLNRNGEMISADRVDTTISKLKRGGRRRYYKRYDR